jgi:hypothetical protein
MIMFYCNYLFDNYYLISLNDYFSYNDLNIAGPW